MEKFLSLTAKVVPLPLKDIDTDMIIPAQYLTSISSSGYGENLFKRLKEQNKDFPLNMPKYQDAKIILAEENFACGSSREHAVWAIMGAGFRVVIAPSFADIFKSNSRQNGLLLITLERKEIDKLFALTSAGELELTVNLEEQTVRASSGEVFNFVYDKFSKHCLINGLDDLDYLRSYEAEIRDWNQSKHEAKH